MLLSQLTKLSHEAPPRLVRLRPDCKDPELLARFWAAALGYVLEPPPEGFATWDDFRPRWSRTASNLFPANLGDVLRRYDKVLVPEVNLGQLALLLRGRFLVDVISCNRARAPIPRR
jgi:hypothetical protein